MLLYVPTSLYLLREVVPPDGYHVAQAYHARSYCFAYAHGLCHSVRLIHAKEPGPNFREDFDHYPVLFTGLERALCPRVHFKIIIFDLQTAYIGSANLTGAGIGMKSTRTRNFEAGILTDDPALVEAAVNQFDSVWAGFKCKDCARKKFCGDPILTGK